MLYGIAFLGLGAMLAIGGRPDPTAPPGMTSILNGEWLFRPGDDPTWASPQASDASWQRVTLGASPTSRDPDVGIPGYFAGWTARGHPTLEGYAWYRRRVSPTGRQDFVLVGPPVVDDGYEIFWNGIKLGGRGNLKDKPRVGMARPALFAVPAREVGREAVIAIRTFMQPGIARDVGSGGLRTLPVLASSAAGLDLLQAQWRRTIAGYAVDAVEPLAMLMLAAIATVFVSRLARPTFARWTAIALTATALYRSGTAIVAWTDALSIGEILWLRSVVLAPLGLLAWTLTWSAWSEDRIPRGMMLASAFLATANILGAAAPIPVLLMVSRLASACLLAVIAVRIALAHRNPVLPVVVMALIGIGQFADELWTLGIPGIWFPFGIGVSRSQYAYALAIPLLLFAVTMPKKDP